MAEDDRRPGGVAGDSSDQRPEDVGWAEHWQPPAGPNQGPPNQGPPPQGPTGGEGGGGRRRRSPVILVSAALAALLVAGGGSTQGGVGSVTADEVLTAVRAGLPVVVLGGTGGFADELSARVRRGTPPKPPEPTDLTMEEIVANGEITDGETVAALAYAGIHLGRFS